MIGALFWISTALLAVVLLMADPVFGSFVVGLPLLVVVLVRERGIGGIPTILFGAAIGATLVFSVFLGGARGGYDDGVLIAAFVIFLVWAGTYPVMVRHMDRQYLREHGSSPDGPAAERPNALARLYLVRAWMTLLAVVVIAATLGRDLLGG